MAPVITSVATALPPHRFTQEEIRRRLERFFPDPRRLRVFDRSGVRTRHFAFPLEYYLEGRSFEERNADFVAQGLGLAERAARECLRRAGVAPHEVDEVFVATTTGLATPGLEARLAPILGLREDVRRSPLFGLGCAGGAGALARAAESVRGRPGRRALVLSVELSGQVFSSRSLTPVDIVGAALFGDGAAAALVEAEGKGPRVEATRSVLFPGSGGLMGWSFTSDGMRLILSPEVASFVGARIRGVVDGFLGGCGTSVGEIGAWVLHPGGRRILEEYEKALGLDAAALSWTAGSLASVGNLSSASVLFILSDALAGGRPREGERGLLCALGPGFAAELLLLRG